MTDDVLRSRLFSGILRKSEDRAQRRIIDPRDLTERERNNDKQTHR